MADTDFATVERLEQLAAWHRANADHAGSSWVWEARLRTAEDLERRAALLRAHPPRRLTLVYPQLVG